MKYILWFMFCLILGGVIAYFANGRGARILGVAAILSLYVMGENVIEEMEDEK